MGAMMWRRYLLEHVGLVMVLLYRAMVWLSNTYDSGMHTQQRNQLRVSETLSMIGSCPSRLSAMSVIRSWTVRRRSIE